MDGRGPDGIRRDDAVSPVLGVILMVAITVVLATSVFLMMNPFTQRDEPPALALSKHEGGDALRLSRAPVGTDWSEFSIRSADLISGLRVHLNVPPDGTGALVEAEYGELPTSPVGGGDSLTFCADSDTSSVEIMIRHNATNQVTYRTTFNVIHACP